MPDPAESNQIFIALENGVPCVRISASETVEAASSIVGCEAASDQIINPDSMKLVFKSPIE